MKFLAHLRTINRHRRLVRKYCFRLGLIWQGLTHDLSKYSPAEFWRSVHYYQGYRSPNDAERQATGLSLNRSQKMPKTEVLKFLVNIRRLRLSFSVHRQIFQIFDKTL